MSEHWVDEAEELLQLLASVAARVDPVPPEVVDAAVGCFKWRSIDAELAELLFDSDRGGDRLVGVRSPGGSRQLTFEAPHLVVELEVDLHAQPQLVGQLVPPGPAEVEIRSPDTAMVVKADEFGRFWADRLDGGAMSLRILPSGSGDDPAATPWVSIAPLNEADEPE